MKFYVYIIYNARFDKFYIGQTNNLERRLSEHNNNLGFYTSKYAIKYKWKLVYFENYKTRKESVRREKFLKNQKSKIFYRKLCDL